MKAIVRLNGSQEVVQEGDVVRNFTFENQGDVSEFELVAIIDDDKVIYDPKELESYGVVGSDNGIGVTKKLRGFTYRPKARTRRRYGHSAFFRIIRIDKIGKK